MIALLVSVLLVVLIWYLVRMLLGAHPAPVQRIVEPEAEGAHDAEAASPEGRSRGTERFTGRGQQHVVAHLHLQRPGEIDADQNAGGFAQVVVDLMPVRKQQLIPPHRDLARPAPAARRAWRASRG